MAKKKSVKAEKSEVIQNDQSEKSAGFDFKSKYVVFAALAILCLIIYAQVFGFEFINIDDDQYVYENPFVSSGLKASNIVWAFTAFHSSNWHPLTWISHQFDSSLFGLNAGAHHFVNVIFHIANSILLFVLVRKSTDSFWKSAIVAAIFAVHPAHVESVAWIAERKDVLSTLFWILSTLFYVRFARNTKGTNFYWISLLLFALGLMSKPMLVTLPFTLILLDYWALGRFENWNVENLLPLVKEKLPFFALSIVSAIITIFAQSTSGAIQTIEKIPLSDRFINALVSYAKYVVMLFYPVNLGIWYPYESDFNILQIVGAAILVLGISAISVWQIHKRKYLFVGWFWFLGTLVPVIGILQVGGQSLADRYTYVPYIGLTIALVWFLGEIFAKINLNKTVIAVICGICLLVFTALSVRQVSFWKNNETLFSHTLAVTEKNYFVEHNFCNYLDKQNRLEEATALCQASIEHNPKLAEGYNTLGSIQLKQNNLTEAEQNFQQAIKLNPEYILAFANLAIVSIREGNFDEAGKYLNQAIEKDKYGFFDEKQKLDAYSTIAVESLKKQNYEKAEEFFRKALEITPNNLDFQRNLAISLHSQKKSDEAIRILQSAIGQHPNAPEVYNSLGLIYAEQNKKADAIQQFQKALQLNPNFAPARNNLQRVIQQ